MTLGHVQPTGPRSQQKRAAIVQAATRHFARNGYDATRIRDIAAELSIAKGSIFQHFGSKAGLFLAVYEQAVETLPTYLDAPESVLSRGFFETLRYWVAHTPAAVEADSVPYQIALLGSHGTDLELRRQINRYLQETDPFGTRAFVRMGIEFGEVRSDVDESMVVSLLEWTFERFQDVLIAEALDVGLFRRDGNPAERNETRIQQFLELLRGAIGSGRRLVGPDPQPQNGAE